MLSITRWKQLGTEATPTLQAPVGVNHSVRLRWYPALLAGKPGSGPAL